MVDVGRGYAGECLGVSGSTFVGDLGIGNPFSHAVEWFSTQSRVYLPTGTYDNSGANAVNSTGQIVGWSEINAPSSNNDGYSNHAVNWINGVRTQYAEPVGATDSYAMAVNSSGVAAGTWDDFAPGEQSNVGFHAARWNADLSVVDLSTPGEASSAADAINDSGTIAGYRYYLGSGQKPNYYVPVIWSSTNVPTILPDLYGYGGIAEAINDAGDVAGVDTTSANKELPFYYDGQLHALPTVANATSYTITGLNSLDQVVGYALLSSGSDEPLLWENGQVYNIDTLVPPFSSPIFGSATVSQAFFIDNNGDIAASAIGTATRPFVLTEVPEPGSLVVLVAAVGPCLLRRRRARNSAAAAPLF